MMVSIIIPAYNVALYIAETLDSVFAQTFTDFEVIIVNDGSPDTTELERALEPYLDRIQYLKQENRGASAARNTGLQAAKGDWVAFLDADDLWLPNYLEQQLRFIQQENVDFVCADAAVFSESSVDHQTYMDALMPATPGESPANGKVTFLGLVGAEQSLITSGIVSRRAPILEVGLFDEALRNAQDYDLWLRLARHGVRMAYQRQVLLCYRRHENSLSGSALNIYRRELRVFDKIEQAYGLTPAERSEALPVIRHRRATLQFEIGKLHLIEGEFSQARASFLDANRLSRTMKTAIASWTSRLAPRLLRAAYTRHLKRLQPLMEKSTLCVTLCILCASAWTSSHPKFHTTAQRIHRATQRETLRRY
jgi:cellulose synthase/poly-beta-1,6-N-acetylglucosamine synthase-like glycosyltransferase